jgi:hypothetical protein
MRASRRLVFVAQRVSASGLSVIAFGVCRRESLSGDGLSADAAGVDVADAGATDVAGVGLEEGVGRSWRDRGSWDTGDPYWRGVSSEEILEYREIRHGRVHHLLRVVIFKFGSNEVSAPELVVAATVALVQLFLDVAHGAVYG